MIEGTDMKNIIIPRTIQAGGIIKMRVINPANHNGKLKKNSVIGEAEQVNVVNTIPQELTRGPW